MVAKPMALVGTTVYDIRIDYKLNDRATSGLKAMGSEAKRTSDALGGLKKVIGVVAGGLAIREGAKALIGYNAHLDQMRIQLGGIISMNMAMPFDKATDAAGALFDRFQEAAKKSPAMTKDFIDMSAGIASAAAQAGMSLGQLHDLTVGGVSAATVFGTRGDVAALDISQMLQGQVQLRDRMARSLLASQGITDHLAFNKLKAPDRAKVTMAALNDPRLKAAADKFGDSFSGQFSTLQDQIQITLGKVGLPLFKQITGELKQWNAWIERNPEAINKLVTGLGNGLVDAFHTLKTVIEQIVAHKDTLLMIGKIWAINKGIGIAGQLATNAAGGAGSVLGMFTGPAGRFNTIVTNLNKPADGLANGFKQAGAGIAGMVGQMAQIAGALAMVYMAASAFANWVDEKQTSDINKRAALAGNSNFAHRLMTNQGKVDTAAKAYATPGGYSWNERDSLIEAQGKRDKEVFSVLNAGVETGLVGFENGKPTSNIDGSAGWENAKTNLMNLGRTAKEAGEILLATELAFKLAKDGVVAVDWANLDPAQRAARAEADRKARMDADAAKMGAPVKVDVTIQKIEVTSDDPDRFVYGMVNAFEDVVQNPTQAAGAMRAIGG